jgi:hypothetical protein
MRSRSAPRSSRRSPSAGWAPETLRWIVGGALVTLGGVRLVRHRHPRYGGMQVGFRELAAWSFLMATRTVPD